VAVAVVPEVQARQVFSTPVVVPVAPELLLTLQDLI
jgi:hypothetical protein